MLLDGVSEGEYQQVLEKGLSFCLSHGFGRYSNTSSELPQLKRVFSNYYPISVLTPLTIIPEACEELKINPKITLIIVGKRHHIRFVVTFIVKFYSCNICLAFRFFPQKPKDADKSENSPAGTVVDRDITHPTDFDYYLQSHAGLKGTSRPAHYYV
jgi:hypothetical protein